jgi:predicted nucleic acid-binding Zn ribbon protein
VRGSIFFFWFHPMRANIGGTIMQKKRFHSGQWRVQRERLYLDSPAPPPPFREAVPLGSIVGDLIRRIGSERQDWLARLARDWTTVAGADVASHTRPGRLDQGCLIVFVDSSVWLSELTRYGKPRLLQNVQAYAGAKNVKRLALQLDPDGGR